jgi:hypothetical protein
LRLFCFVLQHLDFFTACDDFVGRASGPRPTPWSASSAEATIPVWLRLCCLVGQVENLRAGWQPALLGRA